MLSLYEINDTFKLNEQMKLILSGEVKFTFRGILSPDDGLHKPALSFRVNGTGFCWKPGLLSTPTLSSLRPLFRVLNAKVAHDCVDFYVSQGPWAMPFCPNLFWMFHINRFSAFVTLCVMHGLINPTSQKCIILDWRQKYTFIDSISDEDGFVDLSPSETFPDFLNFLPVASSSTSYGAVSREDRIASRFTMASLDKLMSAFPDGPNKEIILSRITSQRMPSSLLDVMREYSILLTKGIIEHPVDSDFAWMCFVAAAADVRREMEAIDPEAIMSSKKY